MQTIKITRFNGTKAHIFSSIGFEGATRAAGFLQKGIERLDTSTLGNVCDIQESSGAVFRTRYKIGVPSGVDFFYSMGAPNVKLVFGAARGEVQVDVPQGFVESIKDRVITLHCFTPGAHANFRTAVGAIHRAFLGVTRGYKQKLKVVGVGYRGSVAPNRLMNLALGYSHSVSYPLDSSVAVRFSRKFTRFDVKGSNLYIVHQTAWDLQSFKEPDVYKGKGVRFRGKKLIKKVGKKKK
jgi:large subunit ribosomal protein L6